jgi:hypothetical protein
MLGYSDVGVGVCVSFEFAVSPFGRPAWIGGSQVEEPVCGRGEGAFRSGKVSMKMGVRFGFIIPGSTRVSRA